MIRFYNPAKPSHSKHFLVERARKVSKTNLAQSSSEKHEEDGKQGDCGGPSHRGSYKGKEIDVGYGTEPWQWQWQCLGGLAELVSMKQGKSI